MYAVQIAQSDTVYFFTILKVRKAGRERGLADSERPLPVLLPRGDLLPVSGLVPAAWLHVGVPDPLPDPANGRTHRLPGEALQDDGDAADLRRAEMALLDGPLHVSFRVLKNPKR